MKAVTLLISTLILAAVTPAAETQRPVESVPSIDLKRYAGKWFEIARYPNRFQRSCTANTTATYSLRPDNKITVLNECDDANGRRKSIKGTARLASQKGPNSRLKVTFFWPFSGDYWIIGLDADYQWAIVGTPKRDYLWILSRQPHVSDELYQNLLARIREQGFDPSRLAKTKQN